MMENGRAKGSERDKGRIAIKGDLKSQKGSMMMKRTRRASSHVSAKPPQVSAEPPFHREILMIKRRRRRAAWQRRDDEMIRFNDQTDGTTTTTNDDHSPDARWSRSFRDTSTFRHICAVSRNVYNPHPTLPFPDSNLLSSSLSLHQNIFSLSTRNVN